MRSMPLLPSRGTQTFGALAAVLLVAAASVTSLVRSGEELPDGVALRVGSSSVTESQLEDYVDTMGGLYGVTPPEKGAKAAEFRRDTAKSMAVSLVLDSAAEDEDVEVTSRDVEDQLNTLVEKAYGGDKSAFVKMLGQKGISEDDVREEIRNQLQNVYVYQRITADVEQATVQEARAYYTEHKDEMVSPEQRRLSNIVVLEKGQAQKIARRAMRGEDFASLARSTSLDGKTRSKGGDLGLLAREDLEEAYAKKAFATPPGQVFGPVKTSNGWNVGQVREVVDEVPLKFRQLKKRIVAKLSDDARIDTWRKWLTDEMQDAEIIYADDYRPDEPDTAPSETPTSNGKG